MVRLTIFMIVIVLAVLAIMLGMISPTPVCVMSNDLHQAVLATCDMNNMFGMTLN